MRNITKTKKLLILCLSVAIYTVFYVYSEDCNPDAYLRQTEISSMQEYDYLNPLLRNPRILPAAKRGWLLFASCPEYAPLNEREYLDKLKHGLLTDEEILYPVLPAMNYEWQETVASDIAEQMKNLALLTHSEPYILQQKTTSMFEVEELGETNRAEVPLYIDDDHHEQEYRLMHTKLQAWAENFEEQDLAQVQQEKEFHGYRFLAFDHWTMVPLCKALEERSLLWLKNILIITDTYDYTRSTDVSFRIVSNLKGQWGPVIVLRINVRKFMDEVSRPSAHDIVGQIIATALEYYSK